MEASGATQTGGDTGGEGQGQTAAPAQQEQTGGPDLGKLVERFDSFAEDFGQKFEGLEARIPEAGQETAPDPFGEQEVYGDPQGGFYDAYGNPVESQQGLGPEQIQQQIDAGVQKALAPIQEHFQGQKIEALQKKYPDLQNDEYSDKLVAKADQLTAQWASVLGEGAGSLPDIPEFLELMHLAQKGRQAAESETPAGAEDQGISVESGSGSNPGSQDVDPGDRIIQATGPANRFFGS